MKMTCTPQSPNEKREKRLEPDCPVLEAGCVRGRHLINNAVKHVAWKGITVEVKDRKTKLQTSILAEASGLVEAGELLAIMGPSGSGKTTLLNCLAHREATVGAGTTGDVFFNGQKMSLDVVRHLSVYVEQEDALIGSLTVEETIRFAADLALSGQRSQAERSNRIDDLIKSFGLQEQRHTIVGTPIKKGLSGGQKKRLGVASCLVTEPKVLFLDEPTSGLDSTLSFEVMNFIRQIAKENKLIVIASIHQPSTSTFRLFDKICLLSKGRTCYFGALTEAPAYFSGIGYQLPAETNPAEFYLDLVNTDLAQEGDDTFKRTWHIIDAWAKSRSHQDVLAQINDAPPFNTEDELVPDCLTPEQKRRRLWLVPFVLLQRSWIKAYRDVVVYEIRVVMYLGLAILMGTVFLRLGTAQEDIQPLINALFFGGAFMSFMAVAYVPAFLEDQATFAKERANGLVGPSAFMVSNFLIGVPFLFLIVVLFSLVEYFMTNFRLSAGAFFRFVLWLFLDLLAAESLVVLVSAIFPVFVVALACTAFANGLWMCVDGFLVPTKILNPFWRYAFHFIDYQAYVFQGMMVNEFKDQNFSCDHHGDSYQCIYPSSLDSEGKINGEAVLEAYNISLNKQTEWVGIMIAIIVVYRLLAYLVFRIRR